MPLDAVARIVDPTRIKERRWIGARAAPRGPPQLLQGREMDQGRRQGRARVKTLYFENPSFGFYLLSLTSARLFQNIGRLELELEERNQEILRLKREIIMCNSGDEPSIVPMKINGRLSIPQPEGSEFSQFHQRGSCAAFGAIQSPYHRGAIRERVLHRFQEKTHIEFDVGVARALC
jgi:hypothetical protein